MKGHFFFISLSFLLTLGPPIPKGLDGVSMLEIQGDVFLFGGTEQWSKNSEIYQFSCSSGICSWTTINQSLNVARSNLVAIPVPDSFCTVMPPCNGNQAWIADGYCDDINNDNSCNFDGGDCCGSNVITYYCSECLCLEE